MDLALSTCWNAPRHRDGKEMLQEIQEMGFKTVELGHNLRFSLWPGVRKAVNEGIVNVCSLHNFCPVPIEVIRPSPNCFEFTSLSPQDRRAAVKATLQTLESAAQVGASAVVLHLGSYQRKAQVTEKLIQAWKSRSLFTKKTSSSKITYLLKRKKAMPLIQSRLRECLDPILKKASELKLKLGVEFRSDIEEFPHADDFEWLFREYAGSPLYYWHDFGHAALMEMLGVINHHQFLQNQIPHLLGAHLQDFSPPDNDHLALGEGSLPLDQLLPLLPEKSIAVLELSPKIPREHLIENLRQWEKRSFL
ncbi:MAG: TIM barrel protein [Verrucomicrobiota bacterium]